MEVALCRGCGVWGIQSVGTAECGSRRLRELQIMGAAECEVCRVWGFQSIGVA